MARLRDPIHGDLFFEGVLGDLVGTEEFQRHMNVMQLGLAYKIFWNATHTRATHMAGASYLAGELVDRLKISEEFKLPIKIAALLHDIGHYDFSHASEHVAPYSHEVNGARIIMGEGAIPRRKNGEINRMLRENGIDPAFIVELLQKEKNFLPPIFYSILSHPIIDCDRMDYLARDTYFTGAGIGYTDTERLLNTLAVKPDTQELGILERGVESLEQFLVARSNMYRRVYFHPITDAGETMLIRAIESSKEVAQPMMYGDEPLLERLLEFGTPLTQDLVRRIRGGKESYYRPAYSVHSTEHTSLPAQARDFERKLEECTGLAEGDILVSMPGAHRKPKPLPGFPVQLYPSGKWVDLSEVSKLAAPAYDVQPSNTPLVVYTKPEHRSKVHDAAEELLKTA